MGSLLYSSWYDDARYKASILVLRFKPCNVVQIVTMNIRPGHFIRTRHALSEVWEWADSMNLIKGKDWNAGLQGGSSNWFWFRDKDIAALAKLTHGGV